MDRAIRMELLAASGQLPGKLIRLQRFLSDIFVRSSAP